MNSLLVVDSPARFPLELPGVQVVSALDYLTDPQLAKGPGRKVFNLCRSLRYQSNGYYVSLLAEARGHRPLPPVAAIRDFKINSVVRIVSDDIDDLIQSNLRRIKGDEFELSVYFGHNLASGHDKLASAIFDAFPAPLLRASFEREGKWRLTGVRVIGLADVPDSHRQFLVDQAKRYLKRSRPIKRGAPPARYELAILHNPEDPMPPSNSAALKKFVEAGEELGIHCQLVGRDALPRLAEFDALFIRETTAVEHHTYRFARRAEALGMPVLDDPSSILRCANKVYLAETLARHRVATPRTIVLTRENAMAAVKSLGLPCVVKLPDGAFCAGVSRLNPGDDLEAKLATLFENSELLVAQEYVPTDFDWRVGVLGGEPLFACRYGMAKGHWQIVHRDARGAVHEGNAQTLAVDDAPVDVILLALKAADLMGKGLYGVDLKVVGGEPIIIEVNDNPNIDAGVEDRVLNDALYDAVMRHFLKKLEKK